MTVYIIQEVVGRNVLSDEKYGKLELLLPEGSQLVVSTGPTVSRLTNKLKNFCDAASSLSSLKENSSSFLNSFATFKKPSVNKSKKGDELFRSISTMFVYIVWNCSRSLPWSCEYEKK